MDPELTNSFKNEDIHENKQSDDEEQSSKWRGCRFDAEICIDGEDDHG